MLTRWEIDDLVPTEEIPYGTDVRPQKHGMLLWRQMFSDRQLLTAVTALDVLRTLIGEAVAETWCFEGEGARISIWRSGLDKALDYNSTFASWDASRNNDPKHV